VFTKTTAGYGLLASKTNEEIIRELQVPQIEKKCERAQ
jgi:hypothetical protein